MKDVLYLLFCTVLVFGTLIGFINWKSKRTNCRTGLLLFWAIAILASITINIDNVHASENTISMNTIKKYCYPISKYPYEYKNESKKVLKTYEEAMKADLNKFVYLSEESDFKLFSDTRYYYKKSIDSSAPYMYFGDLDKNSKPDGVGVIFENWSQYGYDESEAILTQVMYIGHFKDGYMSGYGIKYNIESSNIYVIYEGEFNKGMYHGEGVECTDYVYDVANKEMDDETFDEAFEYLYEKSKKNGLIVSPVTLGIKYYEGSYKEGSKNGKGIQYITDYGNSSAIKYYEGNFKNGVFNGKGTLYFENGNVEYKGEFKGGEYDGKGTLYNESGGVIHKGKFKRGEIK